MSEELSYQKLRGGYYTPFPIINFISEWAIFNKDVTVLEPSCGDGRFLKKAAKTKLDLGCELDILHKHLLGIEIDPNEAKKSVSELRSIGIPKSDRIIYNGDFFAFYQNKLLNKRKFDVILGNPPFIRYQNFPEDYRNIAINLMEKLDLNPNRYTNTWVPFLVLSTNVLNTPGKLGMVIPAELFQVDYAAETRKYLSNELNRLTVITFKKLLFEGIQQEVVLILGEKSKEKNNDIRIIEMNNLDDLVFEKKLDLSKLPSNEFKPLVKSDEKWTQYFLDKEEIELLNKLKNNMQLSGDFYEVDVGVVTGNNNFFLLNKSNMSEVGLKHNEILEIVTRSAHLKGIKFDQNDFKENVSNNLSTFLFRPKPILELSDNAKKYIKYGKEKGVHTGYKCRIRKTWYIVPSVWTPDAFMLRQVHDYPKLIFNETEATSTDTIHRIKFKEGINAKKVVSSFLNSITLAFSEITGRSYGGGVLTFEPSEAERLPIPHRNRNNIDFEEIDKLIRKNEIYQVLDINDKILLQDGLGYKWKKILKIRGIWEKLRDRRINRK